MKILLSISLAWILAAGQCLGFTLDRPTHLKSTWKNSLSTFTPRVQESADIDAAPSSDIEEEAETLNVKKEIFNEIKNGEEEDEADEDDESPEEDVVGLSDETEEREPEPDIRSATEAFDIDSDSDEFQEAFMKEAIDMALSGEGERGPDAAFPNPTMGAVLVTSSGKIIGKGRSNYMMDAVQAVMENAGLKITPLKEWCVDWIPNQQFRDELASSTLYLTLEPSPEAKGEVTPPITKLIEQAGIPNVVIGCPSPIPELAYKGATALHQAGLSVRVLKPDHPLYMDCANLIPAYAELVNNKLHRVGRKHFANFGRPLGFLHCSVVDSDNVEAFARRGNAFGRNFDGKRLNFRDLGAYEIAPPPETVWADDMMEEDYEEFDDSILSLDFEEEDYQGGIEGGNPINPWYEQADAVVATFPRPGNGPADDDSLSARLNGLKWLSTHGTKLPPGVERILVMDATDLEYLPLTNDSPNNPQGVDVEAFWAGEGRKPTRVLLRRGKSEEAKAAAQAAAEAAESAAKAALSAKEAIETGDSAQAAQAAIEYQQAALEHTTRIQKQVEAAQLLKSRLIDRGVIVETIEGGEPIEVMKHLGKRSGLHTVVWRAGCWGERGVRAILAGAFQWVSAHLAVDATGGRFWQLMVAENAVQAACGAESKVKIFADQEDISLEYCDEPDTDSDCSFTMDGRPIRHVRLDCRVALVEQNRPRTFRGPSTKRIDKKFIEEQAPWFL